MYEAIRDITADYAVLWLLAILIGVGISAIISRDIKRENSELKSENTKLKMRNRSLERFAAIAQEEEDKAYVRGYYDSIGGYDI